MPFTYAPAVCQECGGSFDRPQRSDASSTCSERCRVRQFRRLHPPDPSILIRDCQWCGEEIEHMVGVGGYRGPKLWCAGCRKRASSIGKNGVARARLLGRHIERFYAHEVFQRDEWTCALCLGAIDRLLAHPDPLSVSLDHRVPIQRGGDHTLGNCQAAHLVCNLWKGMRTQEEVAAIVPIYSAVSPAWAAVA